VRIQTDFYAEIALGKWWDVQVGSTKSLAQLPWISQSLFSTTILQRLATSSYTSCLRLFCAPSSSTIRPLCKLSVDLPSSYQKLDGIGTGQCPSNGTFGFAYCAKIQVLTCSALTLMVLCSWASKNWWAGCFWVLFSVYDSSLTEKPRYREHCIAKVGQYLPLKLALNWQILCLYIIVIL